MIFFEFHEVFIDKFQLSIFIFKIFLQTFLNITTSDEYFGAVWDKIRCNEMDYYPEKYQVLGLVSQKELYLILGEHTSAKVHSRKNEPWHAIIHIEIFQGTEMFR